MLGGKFDLGAWFPSHGKEQTQPPLDALIKALKEKGITTFGAAGYCFGARYVFNIAFEGEIKAAVISHPSLLEVPEEPACVGRTGKVAQRRVKRAGCGAPERPYDEKTGCNEERKTGDRQVNESHDSRRESGSMGG